MKLSEFLQRKGLVKENDTEQLCTDIHLTLIDKYGWIPVEEYKKIPIPMIFAMLNRLEKEHDEMERTKNKMKR